MIVISPPADTDMVRRYPSARNAVATSGGSIYQSLLQESVVGTNVNLTPELERFAQACVESGRFNNVSEVVRSGLRLLQEAEERRAAFVASLEAAREEGLRDRFATIGEVEAEAMAAIEAVRNRRR
jgi:antitoxin ParD1/3/4